MRDEEHEALDRSHQQYANKFREQVGRYAKSVELQQEKQRVK